MHPRPATGVRADKRGWFKVHRGWMRSFKPEPFTDREAFLWSIEQAAFEAHDQWFNGVRYAVERSEFVTSLHSMMVAFGWSEKRVRGLMERMVKAEKWAKRGANAGAKAPTILTVLNYDLYQSRQEDEGEAKGEAQGERGAKQGRSKGEEQKNGNNGNNGEALERSLEASPSPALPYAEAVNIWTEFASLKGWSPFKPQLPLSDKRRKMLGRVLSEHGLDGWRAGLQRAADSEWLGGHDPPGWFHFTFAINPENFTKIIEGNYDRSFKNHDKPKQSPWVSANARLGGSAGYAQQPQPDQLLLESDARAIEGQGRGVS